MSRTRISPHNHGFEDLQEINLVLIYQHSLAVGRRQFGLCSVAGVFVNFLPKV